MNRRRSFLLLAVCLSPENARRQKYWGAMKNSTTRSALWLLSALCLLTVTHGGTFLPLRVRKAAVACRA